MEKRITIYKGNEYKAKEEKAFRADDVFAEVYLKACNIIHEITRELQEYEEGKKGKERGKYSARYADLGKNIIIFCGTRGQGKTSAMRSFSRLLRGGCREEKFEEQIPVELAAQIKEGAFEVLDPIDPSAMENDESVLRVLISRLFYQLQERIKDGEVDWEDDHNFIHDKTEIVKLFQRCYVNIDYIKSGKGKDAEQDDLEMLAQLGSSAKLKENLHELIEKYLRFMASSDKHRGQSARFLVVPVDDADLATKKVFRLCEDIRNYLSIPNVIIVMAADYEQLVYATYQKYLKQNKVRLQAEYGRMRAMEGKPSQDADGVSQVADDCYKMAAKYLEKVFPAGHRIDLPDMNDLLGNQKIRFYYMAWNKKTEKEESVFSELEECRDIQEQLLKLLYRRTGIVLAGQKEHMHIFLPHTFRELTHMVKLFYDMHDIDCDEIYVEFDQGRWESEEFSLKLHQLRENIQAVKRYFLHYWCGKNLTDAEVRVLRDIDQVNSKSQMAEVYKIFSKYLKQPLDAKATYRGILHDVVEEMLDGQPVFQEAVYIYYSIFLNDWFAAALQDSGQFDAIADFVEKPLELSEEFMQYRHENMFSFFRFRINMKYFSDAVGNHFTSAICAIVDNFCYVVRDGETVRDELFSNYVDGRAQLDVDKIQELEFDMLRPFMLILRGKADNKKERNLDKESITDEEASGHSGDSMPYLVAIRNMIANYDMQVYLRDSVYAWHKKIKKEEKEDKGVHWPKRLVDVYELIDSCLCGKICGIQMRKFADLLLGFADDPYVLGILFLSNVSNLEYFVDEEIKLCIIDLPEMLDKLTDIEKDIQSGEAQKQKNAQLDARNLLDETDRILQEVEDEEAKGILILYDKTGRWDELRGLYEKIGQIKEKLQELLSDTSIR